MRDCAKVVSINHRFAVRVPLPNWRKLRRIERYLGRQARAAHNLGLPLLERYYSTGWLSFRLWRMELPGTECPTNAQETRPQAVDAEALEMGKTGVENTYVS